MHPDGDGIMVWGGGIIWMVAPTDLHIFTIATIDAAIYRDEVIYTYVKFFRDAIGNNVLNELQRLPHPAALVSDYLEYEEIQRKE